MRKPVCLPDSSFGGMVLALDPVADLAGSDSSTLQTIADVHGGLLLFREPTAALTAEQLAQLGAFFGNTVEDMWETRMEPERIMKENTQIFLVHGQRGTRASDAAKKKPPPGLEDEVQFPKRIVRVSLLLRPL